MTLKNAVWFLVEQAIWSERDKRYVFRTQAGYADRTAARKVAKKINGRLLQVKCLEEFMPAEPPKP